MEYQTDNWNKKKTEYNNNSNKNIVVEDSLLQIAWFQN